MHEVFDVAAGRERLAELQDETTTAAWRATVDAAAPGFDEWIVGAVFGGTYQRDGLTPRDRQLLIIGALTGRPGSVGARATLARAVGAYPTPTGTGR